MTAFVKIVPRQTLPTKPFLRVSQCNDCRLCRYSKMSYLIGCNNQSCKWPNFVHGQEGKLPKLISEFAIQKPLRATVFAIIIPNLSIPSKVGNSSLLSTCFDLKVRKILSFSTW